MPEQAEPGQPPSPIVFILAIALILVIAFVATQSDHGAGQSSTQFARGKQIYRTTCIACHHPDPRKEHGTGETFGPPIAGSSFELIKMRVRSTSYPAGYKPKRDTQLMTAFEMNDEDLRALHIFVNQPDAPR